MFDLATSYSLGRTPSLLPTRVSLPVQAAIRVLGSILVASACTLLGPTSLPGVLSRLDAPFPLEITPKTAVAGVGIHHDGSIFVYFAPSLAQSSDGAMLAFLYLHEVGHARLGHLRPEDLTRMRFSIPGMYKGVAWQMEYDADAWAARHALAAGYDPVRGIVAVFTRYGDGGGFTHPPDLVRIMRVKSLVEARR
jgi:hypothetical protein